METKQKLKQEITIVFGLLIIMLFVFGCTFYKIKSFMVEYAQCEDDFKVIEKCGCLPYEGNYSYFKVKTSVMPYDVNRAFYVNYIQTENDE